MPRPKSKSKSKSKSKVTASACYDSRAVNLPSLYEAPPSSPMPHIPPTANLDCGEASLNQEFPLSCARDEPGTKPLLEPSVLVPIAPESLPPKIGRKSRSRRSGKHASDSQPAKPLQDQENIPNNSSSTSQGVAKAKAKRGKFQVQKSFRILRLRGQFSVTEPEKGSSLDGNTSLLSALRLTQGKENDETPYWEASWDKWAHVRGSIRLAK